MFFAITHLIAIAALSATKPAAATSGFDFTPWLPLLGVVLGGLISSLTSFFVNGRSNKQQLMRDLEASKQQLARDQAAYDQQLARDRDAYDQQRMRDELAYTQQKERERIAYERSLQDAKRDRLRGAYKVVLMAAKTYVTVLSEMEYPKGEETEQTRNQRLDALLVEALSGMDEAIVAITLESVGDNIETVFREMQSAFHGYTLEQ